MRSSSLPSRLFFLSDCIPSSRYLSASFHLHVGLLDDGHKLLRDGMAANPSSLLLAYTLADLQEGKQDLTACYSIYDSIIEHLYNRVTQLEAMVEAEIVEAIAEREAQKEEEVKAESQEAEEDTVETREKKAAEVDEIKKKVREKRQPEIDSVKRAAANVWITEMRFARRSDVRSPSSVLSLNSVLTHCDLQGVKQARSVFLKARKSPHLAWQVIEASGSSLPSSLLIDAAHVSIPRSSDGNVLERRCQGRDERLRTRIEAVLRRARLRLPLPRLPPSTEQRQQCVFFPPSAFVQIQLTLLHLADARALFERTVALIEPVKAKPIWDRMAQFEFQCGDYLAAQKMAKRYAEAFPESTFCPPSPIPLLLPVPPSSYLLILDPRANPLPTLSVCHRPFRSTAQVPRPRGRLRSRSWTLLRPPD